MGLESIEYSDRLGNRFFLKRLHTGQETMKLDFINGFLLISRLLLYIHVFYKAYKYRGSVIVISAFWLGALAISAIIAASASTFNLDLLTRSILGYLVAISMFMLALTAKEIKR